MEQVNPIGQKNGLSLIKSFLLAAAIFILCLATFLFAWIPWLIGLFIDQWLFNGVVVLRSTIGYGTGIFLAVAPTLLPIIILWFMRRTTRDFLYVLIFILILSFFNPFLRQFIHSPSYYLK